MASKHVHSLKVERNLDQAVAAAKEELEPDLTIAVNGTSYKTADLVAKLESYVPYFSGARALRSELTAVLNKRDELKPELVAFLDSLRGVLGGLYGATSPELAKFGFAPRKQRAPMTAEQMLARATKAKATRTLRHTMGSKQKAAIKATGTPIIKATMVEDKTTSPAPKAAFTSTLPIVSPPAPPPPPPAPSTPASPPGAASSA